MKHTVSLRGRCAPVARASIAVLAILFGNSSTEALTTYHIGNSLTNDTRVVGNGGTLQMAHAAGLDWTTGWHIDCGQSLETIVAEPLGECLTPSPEFGRYTEALTTHSFDAITLQPFSGTPQGEYLAAKQLIQMAVDPGIVYVYDA